MIELACHTKACAPPPAGVGGSMPMQVFYHLTDKANFKLNPKKVPADNALALRQREAPGLYVAKDSWDVEGWVNGHGYLRPFVVEIEAPKDVVSDERWGGEGFIPADRFGEVRIKRVIPIDAFAREVYGGPGWVESTVGKEFDSGEQPPEDYGQRPYGKEYKYDGPDVRDMPAERIKQLKADATKARRKRNSGSFGVESAVIELACRSRECAPPPVGDGGSLPKGQLSDRVRDMVDAAAEYRDAKTALPESVQTQIRSFMRSRETAFARAERDYRGKDAAPSATTTADFEAEYDALSAILPPEKGMVRRRTPEGERLAATITETLPNAKVVFGSDVNGRIVEEAVGVMAQYPSAVRESIKCVVLGRDPNAVELVGGGTRDTSVVAAWGGHADESGPYETLWLTPRMLGASDADTAAGIGLFAKPADMQSEEVTVNMAEPERRHKIAIAHEMGHVMHTMALSREPADQRGIGRNMTNRMKEDRRTMVYPGGRSRPIMTTQYGEQNTAESVAESFGLAALKGYDNITAEQRAVVDNILDRAGLAGADRSSVTRLELAVADDEDELYGKFEPITDTFEL